MRMRKSLLITALLAVSLATSAQSSYTPSPENLAAREAFSHDRFGIFIHWGIYSMLGQGEWVMQNRNLDYREYARLASGFYPS